MTLLKAFIKLIVVVPDNSSFTFSENLKIRYS
jgi:hypothetical protein